MGRTSRMYGSARGALLVLTMLVLPLPSLSQTGVEITPDVVYGHKDGMALTFDVFQPESDANGVGILFMVSGGWVSTWRPPEQAVERYRFMLDEGFTIFAVRHGSSPRYMVPEAFEDVKLATRYINRHADDFGVDPDRLGASGGSAGGHLSLMLGLTADEGATGGADGLNAAPSRIAAVVAYYPPVDLRGWAGPSERFPALNFDPSLSESISPILHVTPDAPPTLLIHGDADTLVPVSHSTRLFEVLTEGEILSELIVLEGAGHGFSGEDQETAQRALADWFSAHLLD